MIKKTIQYTDLNEEQQTEVVHFHMSRADVIEIIATGEADRWSAILEENNNEKSHALLMDLMRRTYGVKSDDGKRFIRSDELWADFIQTEAYSQLAFELAVDAEAGAAFFNGLLPQSLLAELQAAVAKQQAEHPGAIASVGAGTPDRIVDQIVEPPSPQAVADQPRVLTRADMTNMSQTELSHAIAQGAIIKDDIDLDQPLRNEGAERRVLTPQEIQEMDSEELRSGLAEGKFVIGG